MFGLDIFFLVVSGGLRGFWGLGWFFEGKMGFWYDLCVFIFDFVGMSGVRFFGIYYDVVIFLVE